MQRVNEVDYVIATPDRRKTKRVIYVNLLKKFIYTCRDEVPVESGSASESVVVHLI